MYNFAASSSNLNIILFLTKGGTCVLISKMAQNIWHYEKYSVRKSHSYL